MIGLVRTRIAAVHLPSPSMAGCTGGEISSGRFGIVVVLVEVVVETSIGTTVVVVVVVVVVEVVEVVEVVGAESVDGTDGQDWVATVGTRCAGTALSTTVVVDGVDVDVSEVSMTAMVVVVETGSVSNVTRARESAGATAGASLWVQVSS